MHFRRITSIYQPTNAHIISHKTLLKHFKTLRHISILGCVYTCLTQLYGGIDMYNLLHKDQLHVSAHPTQHARSHSHPTPYLLTVYKIT